MSFIFNGSSLLIPVCRVSPRFEAFPPPLDAEIRVTGVKFQIADVLFRTGRLTCLRCDLCGDTFPVGCEQRPDCPGWAVSDETLKAMQKHAQGHAP